jgi:hypothetical protein
MVPGHGIGRQKEENEQQELGSFFDVHGEKPCALFCASLAKQPRKRSNQAL